MRRLRPGSTEVDLDEEFWVTDPGRLHVRGVMIASIDGAAQASGRAGGLSGEADIRLFALLRSHADVLLVGASTVRAEGYAGERPSAERRAWRTAHGLDPAPPIAVVTRSCDLDPQSPFFQDTAVRPLVFTCEAAPRTRIASLATVAEVLVLGELAVDLRRVLEALTERGLRRVNCEGGPTLLAQLAAERALHELVFTLSPQITCGDALRITNGPQLTDPLGMRVINVFESDGFLFVRYGQLPHPPEAAGDRAAVT